MKQFWEDVGISIVMGLIMPAVVLGMAVSLRSVLMPAQNAGQPTPQTENVMPQAMIGVLTADGQIADLPLDDYLTGVVLAEMPVSFEDEAIKAQSVVARTYAVRARERAPRHEAAAVCTESSCCQGYVESSVFLSRGGKEKDLAHIRELVAATAGQVLTYDGELIEATYFSCSGGTTEDAVAVWGTDVPYLQSVASPGEEHATHYTDTVSFTAAEFAGLLGETLESDPQDWFGQTTFTRGGGVATQEIGGKTYSGTELRKLLGLRSTAFEINADVDTVTVTTRGYGHRVGMSQYGADAMAAAGSTYAEILSHYYQGAELTLYTD